MGRLIKGQGRVVAGELLDARAESARLLSAARGDAERVRAEASAVREAARLEGWQTGRETGLAEVTDALVAARAEAERIRREAQALAPALALRMAEKIVGRAITLDPSLLGAIAGEALAECRARSGPVVIRVHSADLAAVERERPALLARVAAGVELCLQADDTVGRAGCVVETTTGRVDARLSVQLDALERALGLSHA